ncbi:RSP_2648 family PIN domain-containing protein [Rhodobacter sp. NSM]|uniref:RSP_2648 family PIN domain-containing protein n=1 Tax=Rhodobacter sp. NSM TaxID=3457501 RepID=UPI003FCF0229
MRVVLDACVLFPTVLREILVGCASRGLFVPLWSERILEEWARAVRRLGPLAEGQARAEGAELRRTFPAAMIPPQPGLEQRLHLPDEADIHVLAVAIGGHADAILTFNASDFPRGTLAGEGLARRDPDGFLWELWSFHPEAVAEAVAEVHAKAEAISGADLALRALLKRARLPKLAKALQA